MSCQSSRVLTSCEPMHMICNGIQVIPVFWPCAFQMAASLSSGPMPNPSRPSPPCLRPRQPLVSLSSSAACPGVPTACGARLLSVMHIAADIARLVVTIFIRSDVLVSLTGSLTEITLQFAHYCLTVAVDKCEVLCPLDRHSFITSPSLLIIWPRI